MHDISLQLSGLGAILLGFSILWEKTRPGGTRRLMVVMASVFAIIGSLAFLFGIPIRAPIAENDLVAFAICQVGICLFLGFLFLKRYGGRTT